MKKLKHELFDGIFLNYWWGESVKEEINKKGINHIRIIVAEQIVRSKHYISLFRFRDAVIIAFLNDIN